MNRYRHYWIFLAMMVFMVQIHILSEHKIWLFGIGWLMIKSVSLPPRIRLALVFVMIMSIIIGNNAKITTNVSEAEQNYTILIDPYYCEISDEKLEGHAFLEFQGKKEKIRVFSYQGHQNEVFNQYSRLRIIGKLTKPSVARNFYLFDYRHYLKSQGIDYQLEIIKIESVIPIKSLFSKIINWRLQFINHFVELDALPIFSMYNRLIWNLKSTSYLEHRTFLIEFGIIHFFALSGLHVTLIKNNLDYLFRRIGIINEFASILIDIILIVYTFLSGFPIGVMRSVSSYLMKKYLNDNPLDNISFIIIAFLWFQPGLVSSVAFQLSFIISLLLIFIKQELTGLKIHPKLYTTICCLLFSWTITLKQNFIWYPLQIFWGLAANEVFSYLLFPFAFIMTILSYFQPGIQIIEWIGQMDIQFKLWQPYFIVGSLSSFTIISLLFVAGYWLINWKLALKLTVVAYLSLILMAGRFHFERIVVFDVGQGDSLLYQQAFSNKGWLIDVGGKVLWNNDAQMVDNNDANRNIIPALKSLGISQLNGIVITHPDTDHLGNLPIILSNFKVARIYINQTTARDDFFKNSIEAIMPSPAIVAIEPNQLITLPNNKITLFTFDDSSHDKVHDDINDTSIISMIDLGRHRFINMGDLSIEGERLILSAYPFINADIIKLGHHGSRTSTSDQWLNQLDVRLAIASMGVNNRYQHPHQEVVNKLQKLSIPLLQTNQHGAIMIINHPINGIMVEVKINDF